MLARARPGHERADGVEDGDHAVDLREDYEHTEGEEQRNADVIRDEVTEHDRGQEKAGYGHEAERETVKSAGAHLQ